MEVRASLRLPNGSQELLDECGSRPRQADDENRIRSRVARARPFRKELTRKDAL